MKKLIKWLAPALATLMLAGCLPSVGNPTNSFSRPGYWDDQILQTQSTAPTHSSDGGFEIPTMPSTVSRPSTNTTKPTTKPSTKPSTAPSTLPPLPPVTDPVNAAGKLRYTQYGRFTGLYMEDGKDEYISGVAALYVTNVSKDYLEYASVICDINGQQATFVVTGLNPGSSAWVLERNRMVITDEDVNTVVMTHVSDQSSFKADNSALADDVFVTLKSGALSAYNNTGKDLKSVYVYYKKQLSINGEYQDGQYLGGITYRVLLGDIANGETSQAIAGHCTPHGCQVVRIDWE